jgi:signal peptidase I
MNEDDPYNTPPAPERFQAPRLEPPEPVSSPPHREATEASAFAAGVDRPSALEVSETPFGGHPASVSSESVALVPSLPPLEPLPVMAGDFAAAPSLGGADGMSLASRLADEFVAWLKTLASAAVYATLIVTFGFQVARVEGQSMAPTLEDQDRLIVNKFAYLSAVGEPKVGDIVMLYYPNNPKKSFVKRVIAAENQMVRIVDGKVYVNDVEMDDSFVPPEYRSHEDWGPQVVPEGYYFVMGDHRNNSSDSRHWGFVPKKYIIGRVQLRWWPVPEARTF